MYVDSLLIRGGQIVTSAGLQLADVLIDDGVVTKIGSDLSSHSHAEMIEAEGMLLFPGLIDCHVHFREPGLEHKATMATEAQAASFGGVTTVCEMPNTSPPTVTIAALADKVRRAALIKNCDIRFFFGVTQAEHLHALRELWTGNAEELQRLKAHCCGVKVFIDHSTGGQGIDLTIIDDVFKTCGELTIPLVAHCEDAQMNARLLQANERSDVAVHSDLRPPESEAKAIAFAIALAEKYQTPLHIAHLSTKPGIDLVRAAKKKGQKITCEVAPHHLFLSVDDYEQLGTLAKMNPPLRTKEHCEALWQGIADGTVDCIATDHAPHLLSEKQSGEPLKAPSGVPGVETMLPLLLSVAGGKWPAPRGENSKIENRNSKILELCFANPNRIFSLGKSEIVEGARADIVIIDPQKEWTIHGKDLHSKCGWTPYEGWKVKGKVVRTIKY